MKPTPEKSLGLSLLAGRFAVCKLDVEMKVEMPEQATFFNVTRTPNELSVVCKESDAPEGARVEGGWRVLELEGPMDFALTGVISSITTPIADAGIPVFVISTFDTDYLLVKDETLRKATSVLSGAGFDVGEVA